MRAPRSRWRSCRRTRSWKSTGSRLPRSETLGFVGLGVMGAPMAGHLIDLGRDVMVWNRTPSKAESLREKGAALADSLEELASRCSIILICVSRSEDVEEVVSEMAGSAAPGTLFVDHSTIEPAVARSISQTLTNMGLAFMDAPLTGGEKGAFSGELTIFCGGSQENFDRAEPILAAYGKNVKR
ncbi:MAG: NAD(P)-binding domain-containing protein, partial [Armatimonadetes bacterium]|nr:NAD(P)-binding domain-containing protein [Armatimonadota bacterium]